MKPEKSKPQSEAPPKHEPSTAQPSTHGVTDSHTGPYWDALRKLPRVRVGGSIGAGLIFSARTSSDQPSTGETRP